MSASAKLDYSEYENKLKKSISINVKEDIEGPKSEVDGGGQLYQNFRNFF